MLQRIRRNLLRTWPKNVEGNGKKKRVLIPRLGYVTKVVNVHDECPDA